MTDSERLASLETKVDLICKMLKDHLKHHWAIQIILVVFLLGLITEMTVLILS